MSLPNVQELTSLIDRSNPTGATDGTSSVQRAPLGVGGTPDQLLQTEPEGAPASNKDCCTTLCDWIAEVFESCRKFLAQIPCIGCCFLTRLEVDKRAYLEDARSRAEALRAALRALNLDSAPAFNSDSMMQRASFGVSRRAIPPALSSIIRQQFAQEAHQEGDTMYTLSVWVNGLEPQEKAVMEEMIPATIMCMLGEEMLVLGRYFTREEYGFIIQYGASNELFYAAGRDGSIWKVPS